jgi:hypothetical protein
MWTASMDPHADGQVRDPPEDFAVQEHQQVPNACLLNVFVRKEVKDRERSTIDWVSFSRARHVRGMRDQSTVKSRSEL